MKHPKIEVASNDKGRLVYNGLRDRRDWLNGMGVLLCINQGDLGTAIT